MKLVLLILINSVMVSVDLPDWHLQRMSSGVSFPMMDGAVISDSAGAPMLPVIPMNVALNPYERARDVRVIDVEFEKIGQKMDVPPIPNPVPLIPPEIKEIKPPPTYRDSAIYNSKSWYPESYIELTGSGHLFGWPIASVVLRPFRYNPSTGELLALRHIEFEIETEPSKGEVRPFSPRVAPHVEAAIRSLVVNPEIVNIPLTFNGFDYLIITNEYLADTFEAYARWKRMQGYRTEVRTIEWVESHYEGIDAAEKLRNYLKTLADSGVLYVLIGGDEGVLPVRIAYAMTCNYLYPNEDSIRADLYFADIDGTWDADGDGVFGEVEDSVDMYPDFAVGRLPVHYLRKTGYYLRKLKSYESFENRSYQNRDLLLGLILWDDPYTPSGLAKELVDSLYIPDSLVRIKLYESWGTAGIDTTIHELNQGPYLINHNGHGWYYALWVTHDHALTRADMSSLVNFGKYGIFFSTGCWVAAFDYNSIAESYVLAEHGGIAFIGNSRYGWGSPGNPGFGYSDIFDNAFCDIFYDSKVPTLGLVLAVSKARFVPLSQWRNVYRWHEYQINLLGDPSLPVMRGRPKREPLRVEYPEAIFRGDTVSVLVLDEDGLPVQDALVALSSVDGRLIEAKRTGINGTVSMVFDERLADDMGVLWVEAQGFVPFIDTISIAGASTGDFYLEQPILEYPNRPEGVVFPYDSLLVGVPYRSGETPLRTHIWVAYPDSVVESVDPPSVTLDVESPTVDTVRFTVRVRGDVKDRVPFTIRFFAARDSETLSVSLPMVVGAPLLQVVGIQTEFDTGKTMPPFLAGYVRVSVQNAGLATAHNVNASIEASHVIFTQNSMSIDSIPPDSTAVFYFEFSAEDPSSSGQIVLTSDFRGRKLGWTYEFSGNLLSLNWQADFETTFTFLWKMTGHWHIVDYESHSGTHSVYCGIDSVGYEPNWSDTLESPSFPVPYDARLSFWLKFEATNYGVDGIYVYVEQDGQEYLLDFIGSGGALGGPRPLDIVVGWAKYTYDIGFLNPMESAKVKFIFESDSDSCVGEGFFIDDIEVSGSWFTFERGIRAPKLKIHPNPTKDRVSIMIMAPTGTLLTIKVFDISGRLVKTDRLRMPADVVEHVWDLRDENNRLVPNGLYFVEMEASNGLKATTKLVVMR